MQYNEKIINYYYSFFNEIDYLLKYNNNIYQTKIFNNNMDNNMINIIKKSIIETLETPYYYNLFQIKSYKNLLEIIKASYINDSDYKKYFRNHILFKYYIHNNNNNLYYILKILYEYKYYNFNIINVTNNLDKLHHLISNTILEHVNILQKFDILPIKLLENIYAISNLNYMNNDIYLHIVSSLYYGRYVIYDNISILKNINIDNRCYNLLKLNNNELLLSDNISIDSIIRNIIYNQYPATKNNLINDFNIKPLDIPLLKVEPINIPPINIQLPNIIRNYSVNIPPLNIKQLNIKPLNIPLLKVRPLNVLPINIPIIRPPIRPIVKLYDKYYYYIISNNKYYYTPVN